MKKVLLCLCCLGLIVPLALADGPTLQKSGMAKKITPIKMARLNADGTAGPAIPFKSQQRGYEYCLVFDCFEMETDAQGDPIPPPAPPTGFNTCGMEDGNNNESAGNRWFFGNTFRNCYSSNDMEFDPAYGGRYVERMEWGWKWYVNGPGTGENMALVFETFEDFDESCQTGDPNGQGAFLGGVIFYYGYSNSEPNYYWYTDSEDQLYGLDWVQFPTDGSGSYNFWIFTYEGDDPNWPDDFSLATTAQSMLWGTGTNEWINIDCIGRGLGDCPGGMPPDGTTSHQGLIGWWDVEEPYGWHTTGGDECWEFSYGVCPDPLGAMWCAYAGGPCGEECPGDIDGDGDTDHSDLGELLSAWCSSAGDPNWNPNADLDGDGHVGHGDLGILLSDWGCGT